MDGVCRYHLHIFVYTCKDGVGHFDMFVYTCVNGVCGRYKSPSLSVSFMWLFEYMDICVYVLMVSVVTYPCAALSA